LLYARVVPVLAGPVARKFRLEILMGKMGSGVVGKKEKQPEQRNAERDTGWTQGWQAPVAALLVLGIYVRTLPPTVVGGDSGEIVVAAWKLVFAHPPGYPLITLIGHVFCHYILPIGEPAWRMGVLNAMFGAGTTALLVQLMQELTGCSYSALAAALQYTLSPLVWQYATTPEVFALNNMFAALILRLLVSFALSPSNAERVRHARWGALVCSLALSNQHTIVLLVLPIFLYVATALRHYLQERPGELLIWLAALFVGVSPYLILGALSGRYGDELYSWGDTSSWVGLAKHILRQEYGTFDLISGFERTQEGLVAGAKLYVTTTSEQSLHLAFPSVLLVFVCTLVLGRSLPARLRPKSSSSGSDRIAEARREALQVILLSWAGYVGFFLWRSNLPLDHPLYHGVVKRFYMQPNMLVAVMTAASLAAATTVLPGGSSVRTAAGWLVCTISAGMQVGLGWAEMDLQRTNVAIKAYGLALVEGLPETSVVLTKGDLTIYPTRYVQACLGVRPDVVVMDQEVMGYDWYIPRVRRAHTEVVFPPGVRLRPVGPRGRCAEVAVPGGSGSDKLDPCARYEGVFNLMQFFTSNFAKTARGHIFIVDPKTGDHSFQGAPR